MIRQLLAFPIFPPPSLSQVKSLEALRRHAALAIDYGTNPMAAEYLAEIARRTPAFEPQHDMEAVA